MRTVVPGTTTHRIVRRGWVRRREPPGAVDAATVRNVSGPARGTAVGLAGVLTLLSISTGCGLASPRTVPPPEVPARILTTPSGQITSVAWVDPEKVYVMWYRGLDPTRLLAIDPESNTLRYETIAAGRDCTRDDFLRVDLMDIGTLGMTRYCHGPFTYDTGVYDVSTATYRPLVHTDVVNPAHVTWFVGQAQGFFSRTNGSCAAIAPMTLTGPQRWPGPMTLDGATWDLGGYVFGRQVSSCAAWGRADLPRLTPDQRNLYFVGSPESLGLAGSIRREETVWHLYRMPLGLDRRPSGAVQRLTDSLGKPLGLAVSPDGTSLAFAGQFRHKYGLWLIRARDGKITRLARGKYLGASFSPDGSRLTAFRCDDIDRCMLWLLGIHARR